MGQQIIQTPSGFKVVDVGPPGPPGFIPGQGSSGPKELLPITIGRLVPFAGWTNLNFPIYTMQWFGYRIALGFCGIPMVAVMAESMVAPSPIHTSKGGTYNLSVTGMGIDFVENAFPDDWQLRVVISTSPAGSIDPPTERTIATFPIVPSLFVGPPTAEAFEALFSEYTSQNTFTMDEGETILGIQLITVDAEGDPVPAGTMSKTFGLIRLSMWQGSPTAHAVVDIDAPYTMVPALGP